VSVPPAKFLGGCRRCQADLPVAFTPAFR